MSRLPPDKLLNVQDVSRLLPEALMSADQVPIKGAHSTMPLARVGCPGRRIERAVRPPNCYITPDARCDLVHAAIAAGSLSEPETSLQSTSTRLRIWGSGVRISSGAPIKSNA